MFYLLFFVALAASIIACWFITKKGENAKRLEKIIKFSTVLYITFSMSALFLPDLFVAPNGDAGLEMPNSAFHAAVRWLNAICFVVLPIAIYQKNKYFEKIASFVCLPIAILNVACYTDYIYYLTKVPEIGGGIYTITLFSAEFKAFLLNEVFRAVFFGLTCLFQIVALALITHKNRKTLAIAKGEGKNFALILLGVTYMSMPVYVLQYFFGHVDPFIQRFTPEHIAWIIAIPAIIVALYFGFRKKSYEARYLLVLSLSWALMYQFTQMFSAAWMLSVMKLPLQLCNLGSYLALIMLAKKSQKIYHFTLIVNVVGAVIAVFLLDILKKDSSLTHFFVIHYIVEHTRVLAIPILCLILKVFKPITLKSLKHFTVGFTIYWAAILVIDTISNGLKRLPELKDHAYFFNANHLFMFDKAEAKRLVGFTDPLFDGLVIKFGTFELYPLVQILVYIVFMALCVGVFFIIYALTSKMRKNYVEE